MQYQIIPIKSTKARVMATFNFTIDEIRNESHFYEEDGVRKLRQITRSEAEKMTDRELYLWVAASTYCHRPFVETIDDINESVDWHFRNGREHTLALFVPNALFVNTKSGIHAIVTQDKEMALRLTGKNDEYDTNVLEAQRRTCGWYIIVDAEPVDNEFMLEEIYELMKLYNMFPKSK